MILRIIVAQFVKNVSHKLTTNLNNKNQMNEPLLMNKINWTKQRFESKAMKKLFIWMFVKLQRKCTVRYFNPPPFCSEFIQ